MFSYVQMTQLSTLRRNGATWLICSNLLKRSFRDCQKTLIELAAVEARSRFIASTATGSAASGAAPQEEVEREEDESDHMWSKEEVRNLFNINC